MIKKSIWIILFSLCFFAGKSMSEPRTGPSFYITGLDVELKDQFLRDMGNLQLISTPSQSKWALDNLGFDSSNGKNILNFIHSKFPLVVGNNFEFKSCEYFGNDEKTSCTNNPNGIPIPRTFANYSLPNGFASVSIPNSAFPEGANNMLLVVNNRKLQMTGLNNFVLKIKGPSGYALGPESSFWYRISYYIALARSAEMISKGLPSPYSCYYSFNFSFSCERYSNGVFATLGVFMHMSANACASCNTDERMLMILISVNNLLSIDGESKERALGQFLFEKYKNDFIESGLDVTIVTRLYRASLLNNKEAPVM